MTLYSGLKKSNKLTAMCHKKVVEMSQILEGISTLVPTRPPAPTAHRLFIGDLGGREGI